MTLTAKGIVSKDIIDALYARHNKDVCLDEVRASTGYNTPSRIDFWAINAGPVTGNLATSYEVKVSRGDFRRDTHKKQRMARLFSDHMFYVAPVGVIPHDEVPDWAGLYEVEWSTHKYINNGKPYLKFKKVITAPKMDKDAPSWGFLVSMMRKVMRDNPDK